MIRVDEERLEWHGTKVELMAQLTELIRELLNEEAMTEEDINTIVETAFKDPEEVEKEAKEMLKKFLEGLGWLDS